jgi:hypothetical protein
MYIISPPPPPTIASSVNCLCLRPISTLSPQAPSLFVVAFCYASLSTPSSTSCSHRWPRPLPFVASFFSPLLTPHWNTLTSEEGRWGEERGPQPADAASAEAPMEAQATSSYTAMGGAPALIRSGDGGSSSL